MTNDHRKVVHYIRDYFEQQFTVPELRTLLKHLHGKFGKEKAARKYVYKPFPYGY